MSHIPNKNLWGGRFTGETDRGFAKFNSSLAFDRRLFEVDVRASLAHCDRLAGVGVLTIAESEQIKSSLSQIMDLGRSQAHYSHDLPPPDAPSFLALRLLHITAHPRPYPP